MKVKEKYQLKQYLFRYVLTLLLFTQSIATFSSVACPSAFNNSKVKTEWVINEKQFTKEANWREQNSSAVSTSAFNTPFLLNQNRKIDTEFKRLSNLHLTRPLIKTRSKVPSVTSKDKDGSIFIS